MFRMATADDVPRILEIVSNGREHLRAQGLPQWQDGYGPALELIEAQVGARHGYVVALEGRALGYAALIPGPEAEYESASCWGVSVGAYTAIHTVAVGAEARGKGIGRTIIKNLLDQSYALGYLDVRADTHPQNTTMKSLLSTLGFAQCGDIMLDIPNGERVAYQHVLPEPRTPYLRISSPLDIDAAEAVIDSARSFLREQGLPQWQGGYGPNRDSVALAVGTGAAYVLVDNGKIHGYASLDPGPDHDYEAVEPWRKPRSTGGYTVINNISISTPKRGYGSLLLARITEISKLQGFAEVRSCTHKDNQIMRHSFLKAGLTEACTMRLDVPSGERIGYQMILD